MELSAVIAVVCAALSPQSLGQAVARVVLPSRSSPR